DGARSDADGSGEQMFGADEQVLAQGQRDQESGKAPPATRRNMSWHGGWVGFGDGPQAKARQGSALGSVICPNPISRLGEHPKGCSAPRQLPLCGVRGY